MTQDAWNERRRALEDSFFLHRNQELLEQLRQQLSEEKEKEALAAASGIQDETILEHLLKADIHSESVVALSLVPLVLVAWADGKIAKEERKAVLSATKSEGIGPASFAYQLLERWLETKPEPGLLIAWKDYIGALREQFSPAAYESFRADVMGRAHKVAKAAGGMLGLKSISSAEQKVLDDLDSTFAA